MFDLLFKGGSISIEFETFTICDLSSIFGDEDEEDDAEIEVFTIEDSNLNSIPEEDDENYTKQAIFKKFSISSSDYKLTLELEDAYFAATPKEVKIFLSAIEEIQDLTFNVMVGKDYNDKETIWQLLRLKDQNGIECFLTGIHLVNTLRAVNIHYAARVNKYYEILEPGNLRGELKSFSTGFLVIFKNKEEKWCLNDKEVKYHIFLEKL